MKYVFSTKNPIRYTFPTHFNDLVMDRSESETSEAFVVVIEPKKDPPLHKHDDTEQIFYILEGEGDLEIVKKDMYNHHTQIVYTGDIVRIPPRSFHTIHCRGDKPLKYLAIDCFIGGKPKQEPSWESHVKVLCKEQGWNYSQVKPKI
jgi:mannose-6-phosphate isomerase-like protein (cupin superfamily)